MLTANHVIADGSAITIVFADGTKSTATVASADPKNDIATLTPKKLPQPVVPATLGGGVAVGADVVAIGNPLGLPYSIVHRHRLRPGPHRDHRRRAVLRADPVRRRGQPGQLRRSAAERPGPRRRHRACPSPTPDGDDAFAGIAFAVPIGTALGGGGPGGRRRGPTGHDRTRRTASTDSREDA